jgi:5-hmdU DNA kinase-like protein
MNIEPAIYFITERESIRRRREAGEPAPWTTDPILRDYRFCNVRREDDAVTRHISQVWREPHKNDPHLWFAMAVARFINWPATLDVLPYPVPFVREDFRSVLKGRMERLRRDESLFGPAYKIPCGKKGQATVDYLADDVLYPLWKSRENLTPKPGNTLEAMCGRLRDFNGLKSGGFMAGQVIADWKYVEPLRSAPDFGSFVVSGPGSKKGLNRILGQPVDAPWTESAWQTAFRRFEAAIRPELQRIGLGDLHCQDLQNVLCETDKYLRTKLGEGKPKRRFAGGAPRKIAA